MLWLGLMLIVIGLCSSGTLATTMGPPAAGLEKGKYGVGLEYSNSKIGFDIDGERTSLTLQKVYINDVKQDYLDKEFQVDPEKFKFKEEFESDMIFANFGYGVSDKLEVFLRLGMADFDANDMDGSSEFAYGLGAKATFYEEGNLKLGALLQMTWAKADGDFYEEKRIVEKDEIFGIDEINETIDTINTWEIDYYQLKFAVGPTYKLTETFSIYGGPFYHLVSGDYEMERSGEKIEEKTLPVALDKQIPDTDYSEERSGDIEEQSSFGAYIGAQVDLAENLPLCIEYQFTGDADVLGASLVYRF
jgi:opacity protein-like surface antigen